MYDDDPTIEISKRSSIVTLEGVAVKVRIYRPRGHAKWLLAVIGPDNTYTFFDASFDTEIDAMAAFQATVQEEGVGTFVDRGDTETLH